MPTDNNPIGINTLPVEPPLWNINTESKVLDGIRQRAGLTDEEFSSVLVTAIDILSHCPNPLGGAQFISGLALGKVQSGKTLSYTTLIALAVENGYRNIIVIAGTKNPLLEQNFKRLEGDLGLNESGDNERLRCFRNPDISRLSDLRSIHRLGMSALYVILKNKSRIDHLRELMSSPEIDHNLPTLIIDDEGDEASLNTQFRHQGNSAIYASISSLREVMPKHAYIAYTATPQANLLQQRLSRLNPNFCSLIEPGMGYCGGSMYFGDDINDFVRIVTDDEADHNGGIPQSLQQAIAIFLVGGAIRHLTNSRDKHRMLIHSSRLTRSHTELKVTIEHMIELWRTTLITNAQDPSRQGLIALFSEAYKDLIKTVLVPLSEQEVLERVITHEILALEMILVNSLPAGVDPNTYPYVFENNILIGGDKLGRGVTIKGLAVTYMIRRARGDNNADTLEQRARWFGYRKKYLGFCRVFLTTRLRDDYVTLLAHEDDFWDSLRRSRRQNIALTDWPRLFKFSADETLIPTRRSVAEYHRFIIRGWMTQHRPVLREDIASRNNQIIHDFFNSHPALGRIGNNSHGVIDEIPVDVLVNELISKVNINGSDFDSRFVSEYLMRLSIGGKLNKIKVVYIDNGIPRKRTEEGNQPGTINPFQGSNRSPGDPAYYPGDQKLLAKEAHLQVHVISYHLRGQNIPLVTTSVFALYLPEDERFDLSFIVGGEQ